MQVLTKACCQVVQFNACLLAFMAFGVWPTASIEGISGFDRRGP
jgi:hypothetical protein